MVSCLLRRRLQRKGCIRYMWRGGCPVPDRGLRRVTAGGRCPGQSRAAADADQANAVLSLTPAIRTERYGCGRKPGLCFRCDDAAQSSTVSQMGLAQVFQPGMEVKRCPGRWLVRPDTDRGEPRVSTATPPAGCLDRLSELPAFGLAGKRWRNGFVLQNRSIPTSSAIPEARGIRGGKAFAAPLYRCGWK